MCDRFPIQNRLKQGDALQLMLLNFSLEYPNGKVKENQVGRQMIGKDQLLVYNDVNLLGVNINTIKKNTEALIDASKEVGLEVYAERTKYVLIYCSVYPGNATSN
jgi:hypothetical protein